MIQKLSFFWFVIHFLNCIRCMFLFYPFSFRGDFQTEYNVIYDNYFKLYYYNFEFVFQFWQHHSCIYSFDKHIKETFNNCCIYKFLICHVNPSQTIINFIPSVVYIQLAEFWYITIIRYQRTKNMVILPIQPINVRPPTFVYRMILNST